MTLVNFLTSEQAAARIQSPIQRQVSTTRWNTRFFPSLVLDIYIVMRTVEMRSNAKFQVENPAGNLADSELVGLLTKAYVGGGFTSAQRAATLFEPSAIRSRGEFICVRSKMNDALAGIVIIVLPDSPARRLAEFDEAELHLLAVDPKRRGLGLGRILVTTALASIRAQGIQNTVLWTQPKMVAAQRLYESLGFVRADTRDPTFEGIQFLAYQMRQS